MGKRRNDAPHKQRYDEESDDDDLIIEEEELEKVFFYKILNILKSI
jgi:hypothetical protein